MNARAETVEWLTRYYRLVDEGRIKELFSEYLDERCTFRVGGGEPVGFMDEARRLATIVKGVRHELISVLEGDDGALACELKVTYFKHDGSAVTLPGSLFATVVDGRFVEQRAYVDQGPLFA